ncbi:GIY-YIG nuclease family protein [Janibacter hoylei]
MTVASRPSSGDRSARPEPVVRGRSHECATGPWSLRHLWDGAGPTRSRCADVNVDAPLYIGKAERSLVSRDLQTHFTSGKTGQSSLRRSLAALLRVELDLTAQPRNPSRPDGRGASHSSPGPMPD